MIANIILRILLVPIIFFGIFFVIGLMCYLVALMEGEKVGSPIWIIKALWFEFTQRCPKCNTKTELISSGAPFCIYHQCSKCKTIVETN